jgi:hypothetical protein
MTRTIGQLCARSAKLHNEIISLHNDINEYCNKVAQDLLSDSAFEFMTLPDPIVEIAHYGGETPKDGWAHFIQKEVRYELNRLHTFGPG